MFKKIFFLLFFFPLFLSAKYPEEALNLPIYFSQVREDPTLDLEVIQNYFPEEKIDMLMIASGGDTAAFLASSEHLKTLEIVDPNPVQIALTKMKIHLLQYLPEKRLKLLGHESMDAVKRKEAYLSLMDLLDIPEKTFGPIEKVSEKGLDYAGRYEYLFSELQKELSSYKKNLLDLFLANNLQKQQKLMDPSTNFGKAFDQAFEKVMSLSHLVSIFGEKATQNPAQNFSSHFIFQTRDFLSKHLAKDSPFLAQMLLGRFFEGTVYPWYLQTSPQRLPKIHYENLFMNDLLKKKEKESYHVIHLSNILDWLSEEEAKNTLSLAYEALKPGGVVIIRQLNSNLNIPSLLENFQWNFSLGEELNEKDLSFFYRNFFVGQKPYEPLAEEVTSLANFVLEEEFPVIKSSYFERLINGEMTLEEFKKGQEQFFYAVDYFSKPMANLVSRLPLHEQRIDILHNVVEEHGDFDESHYHSNTFLAFLERLGVDIEKVKSSPPEPFVHAFNIALMGACSQEDPIVAIACNGIIEYAFADISQLIADQVLAHGWLDPEQMIHYSLHAAIDKRHAEEFFSIIEPYAKDPEGREKILAGLRLGAHIFRSLYDNMNNM